MQQFLLMLLKEMSHRNRICLTPLDIEYCMISKWTCEDGIGFLPSHKEKSGTSTLQV